MRKGFLIYEEMLKYLTIYEEAISNILLKNRSLLNFLIYMYKESFILFLSVHCYWCQKHRHQICYWSQLHRLQFATGINDSGVKFVTGTVGVVDMGVNASSFFMKGLQRTLGRVTEIYYH